MSSAPPRTARQSRPEAAALSAAVALALIGTAALAATELEGRYAPSRAAQLQRIADAAALAGAAALRAHGSPRELAARARAALDDSASEIAIAAPRARATDFEVGRYDEQAHRFTPGLGGSGSAAYRVTVRSERASGFASAAASLFASRGGRAARATAVVVRRDLVIVHAHANGAVADALPAWLASLAPDDRVAFVRHSDGARESTPLAKRRALALPLAPAPGESASALESPRSECDAESAAIADALALLGSAPARPTSERIVLAIGRASDCAVASSIARAASTSARLVAVEPDEDLARALRRATAAIPVRLVQ